MAHLLPDMVLLLNDVSELWVYSGDVPLLSRDGANASEQLDPAIVHVERLQQAVF